MNKMITFLLMVVVVLSLTLSTTIQSRAQQSRNFAGVVPFVTSTDRVGFLNQANGRVYIYDSNLTQCLFIGQIQNLGDPIQAVTAKSSTSNL